MMLIFSLISANVYKLFVTVDSAPGGDNKGVVAKTASLQYIGCYTDSSSTSSLTSTALSLPGVNTPQYCADLCLYLGYGLAGVELGQ
jgi:hypothetical protein